jgi:pimeloyl-ACP methyl ester carboxylesterase
MVSQACAQTSVRPFAAAQFWNLPTGSHIAYVEFPAIDQSSATPIVCLHGGPGGYAVSSVVSGWWNREYQELADLGFNVYVYDQVGGGLSGRLEDPSRYTVARHVADLGSIWQKIGNKPCILIAGSWGPTLAAHYMAAHPENVLKAVFISPKNIDYCDLIEHGDTLPPVADCIATDSIFIKKWFGENAGLRYDTLIHLLRTDIRQAHDYAGDAEMDMILDSIWSFQTGRLVHDHDKALTTTVHGMGWWSFVMTGWDATHLKPIKDKLRSNRTPVLILRGDSDIIPEETAREYENVFQNARFVPVRDCGHMVSVDQPEVLLKEIKEFLKKK